MFTRVTKFGDITSNFFGYRAMTQCLYRKSAVLQVWYSSLVTLDTVGL